MKKISLLLQPGLKTERLIVIFFFAILSSCVTNKKTTYLQELKDSDIASDSYTPEDYIIRPDDNLFIRVTTPDPRFSEMFNTMPATSGNMSTTEASIDLLSYPVMQDGTVDIPYLGSVHVAGKTVAEAKDILQEILIDYITDASITLKLVNNYVSILGEVTNPGLFPIYKEHLNIFQAISMASDLDDFSDRREVSIIRSSTNGSIVKEFNLTDKNIIDSEYYYVMPNDVIYVKPMKGKFFALNQFPYVIILTSVTTFLVILTYIDNN